MIRLLSLFLLMTVSHGISLAQAPEKSEKMRELSEIRENIEKSKLETSKIDATVRALSEDRAKLQQAAIEAGDKARAYEARLSQTELRLLMLETNEQGMLGSLKLRQGQIGDILSALQRMGQNPPPALINSSDDTMKAIRTSSLLATLIPEMKNETDSLKSELEELRDVRRKSAAERDLWKKDMTALHEERQKLDALSEARQFMLNRAEGTLKEARDRAAKLANEATSLEQLLARLDEPVLKPSLPLPPQSKLQASVPFKQLIGKIKWPVQGRIIQNYGATDSLGLISRGVTLTTQQKAVITAPIDANVLYAGPFRSYKQLLILNAGDGYHLVIAGMEKISVETGQFVLTGEPIAMMGEGSSLQAFAFDKEARPALYLELRKDNNPISPLQWMIAQN